MAGSAQKRAILAVALVVLEVVLPAASPVRAMAVHCTATGTKYLAISAMDVCARFVRSGGWTASAVPPPSGLRVVLSFLPQGIAKADVTHMAGGIATKIPPFELAVSDRKLDGRDIDTLAADVSAGLAARKLR